MSDIQLFRLTGQVAVEIKGTASDLEKPLQTLIEVNLGPLLAIRLLASEYRTGKVHAGRIDTLGLDENDCPVIIEYKRSTGENVISQGLFYLDWLMDHQAEFKLLVLERHGKEVAEAIDWSSPRLVCIAADFTRYDAHAVQQINRNIDLIRYRRFGVDLLLLELVNAVTAEPGEGNPASKPAKSVKTKAENDPKPRPRWLPKLSPALTELFGALDGYITSLGDDVQRKDLKLYVGYKRLRNFATVVGLQKSLILYLHLDPMTVKIEQGFTRNVENLGHWGTGAVEVTLTKLADLEKAKPYLQLAYEGGPHAG
jgi:predicted transport protein